MSVRILPSVLFAVGVCASGFGGSTLPEPKDREWKVVYSSADGVQGRALELLTAEMGPLVLRDSDFHTFRVLPLERDGGALVPRKNEIIVGTWSDTPSAHKWLEADDVPKGGYCVKAWNQDGTNRVVIAGDRAVDVLHGVVDFVEDGIPALSVDQGNGIKYRSRTFDGSPIGVFAGHRKPRLPYVSRRAPQTKVRSLFTWGHVVDDYRQFFKEVARLRLNRVILWNDFPPVNASEVVACAHSWGIEVYWGAAWGWTTGCREGGRDFQSLADEIVTVWRRNWRDLPGDGLYFQTFTERDPGRLGQETVAERAVRLVNVVAGRIRAERPNLPIVFMSPTELFDCLIARRGVRS